MADISSQIVAVIVFSDRARVTRRGKAALAAGTHRLVIPELPASLDPASLRVAARGTVPVKLMGVDCRRTFFTEPPDSRVRELEARVQSLQDDDTADADRLATLVKHLAHIDGLADATRVYAYGLANGKTTIEQQTALLTFLNQQRSGFQESARAVTVQRRERAKELEKLHREIQERKAPKSRQRYTIAADMDISAPGEVELDVTYVLPDACWRPLYDIRLRGEELEITYLAEIQQNTGEDWPGVALTLSTARPGLAAAIPRLKPWHIHARLEQGAAPVAKGMRPWAAAAAAAGEEAFLTMAVAAPPAMAAAEVETATVEQRGGSVIFQIARGVDVPSDNTPHKATVGIFALRPQFDYVSIPKLAEAVFRRAKAANASAFTLLPGRAQLFMDDDYLGPTDLALTAPRHQFELFFGADDRLRVERGLTKRDVGKSFLGGRRRIHYAYEIRLWNHTGAAQKLTVVDQVPLPQHEDVKVTMDAVEPKPSRHDDLNILVWKLSVDAGAELKIGFAFTLEHPRELTVDGLG